MLSRVHKWNNRSILNHVTNRVSKRSVIDLALFMLDKRLLCDTNEGRVNLTLLNKRVDVNFTQ